MRKRNKAGRGARALSARRGNSRVPGNRTESSSSRSGRGGGGRGKSPMTIANTPAAGITTNGVFKPAIPERYCRNGINVGVGSAAMLSISSSNGIISSDFYLHKKFKKIADVSEDVAAGGSEDDSKSNLVGSKTADVSASSSVVYKPKFRIVEKPEELSTPPMSESSTTTPPPIPSPPASLVKEPSPPSSIEESKVMVPGKINSGERMDRQSLDDRISKIIDENQSILSSIREPWGKKQRSRQQQQQQQPQAQPQQNLPADLSAHRNGIVIMSGGLDGAANNFSPVTLRPVETTASVVVPPQTTTTVLIRSHPDAGGQVVTNEPNTDPLAPTDPLPNSSTVVPKKRRRLSPTPNRLCGGEVSELPKQEAPISQTHPKSYYHDVDMTVRVSKCGTSGARVTVRTNNNNNGASTAGSYSRLLDVPSTSPLKHIPQPEPLRGEPAAAAVLFVHTDSQSPQQQMTSLSPLRYSPSAIDLKGILPRGRPPKKGKLVIDDQPASSPSVIVNAAIKIPPSPSPVALKRAQISPPTAKPLEVAVVKVEPEDQPEVSKGNSNMSPPPLVLQSSAPNPKRPTFLALKPLNPWPKKPDPGVLPSPETPRGARAYNQMYINGQAYTSLLFKVSTRSSYTCLLKPQPTFLEQDSEHRLSMYSNWQPRSRGKIQEDLPISLNDSRVNGRKSPRSYLFTLAGQKCTTTTVDSPDRNKSIVSLIEDMKVATTPSSSSSSTTELSPAMHISSQDPSPRKVEPGPSSSVPLNLAGSSYPRITHDADYEAISSGSSCGGSADESVNVVVDNECGKRSRSMSGSRRPLALNSNDYHDMSRESTQEGADDDKSSSSFSQFDNPRVKIMEGGFESNEDYTYVRGRVCDYSGRGRYVCEACGIRCKKPSMLRKHLKTHTDLRPYTCKLCNFSFKTKGNLTKHQKSKSHHKKCIGLGIHPESQRSLAMIGPQFSDTNSTDESDDEDDAGCYNGDTDSQDEVDGDDASSSAEPENGELLSQSFEKEIAQSLLDLSKMGRMGSGEVVVMKNGMDTPPFEVSRLSSGVKANGVRIPVAVVEANDNSMSVESSSGGGNVEIPIDLSCRSKSSCGETDPKRFKRDNKNCYVRSFGVVAEAQKWEPEEEFMISGCLNLKKVPNDNNNSSSNKSLNVNGSFTRVNGTVMIPADVKPEVRGLNLNNNIGEKLPYEFQLGKRKREASTSSSYGEPVNFSHLPKQSPAPAGPPPAPPAANHPQTPPKPQKLHQPWLSPEENKSTEHAAVVVKQDVDCLRKSPTTVGNNFDQKVLDSCDLNRESAILAPTDPQRPLASSSPTPKVFPALTGFKPQAEFREPSGPQALVKDEGKAECNVCGKVFARASQLSLHMNIHYLERPFRCDPCGVSFRTKGHLIKHRRSSSHDCKVKVCLNDSWGVANEENPRPFKCPDCKIAFRIHGHLAKHLRSKMHIMRMECLGKLPFGIYFEMEKCGLNLTEIDTSDCDMSLISLQGVAKRIYGDSWTERLTVPMEEPV